MVAKTIAKNLLFIHKPTDYIVNEVKMHQRQPAHCILFCKIPRCSGATSFRYFLVVENNIIKF